MGRPLPFVKRAAPEYDVPVLPSPCYIFSDTHLGFASADVERQVISYLRHLRNTAGSVVINGDLFEFWFEWKTVVPRSSVRVLAALADLTGAGVPVMMIAGNHDCWGGEILRDDIGLDYRVGAWSGTLAGWTARVEHGDGLRAKEDRGYRAIRPILRNGLAKRAFRLLPPDLATRLATGSSHASRSYVPRDAGRGLREIAAQHLEAEPSLELLVYGHSHVAALERIPSRGVYGNAGSWLDAPTFLRVTAERASLMEWGAEAEGAEIRGVDRVT
jgi:UDP-2,3-diacylglucosamine hydrolase